MQPRRCIDFSVPTLPPQYPEWLTVKVGENSNRKTPALAQWPLGSLRLIYRQAQTKISKLDFKFEIPLHQAISQYFPANPLNQDHCPSIVRKSLAA